MNPLFITVAPNGARKTKQDHPALPITPEELAIEARACADVGAAMIHLHVRDAAEKHSLDVGRYREAMAAIQESCGGNILIQATTEAVGIYSATEQMKMVRELLPPSASVAIRELAPEGGEDAARAFFHDMSAEGMLLQYILYSADDVLRFNDLRQRGFLPQKPAFLLFVLGRYTQGQVSDPKDLLPFLDVVDSSDIWAVCAFGPMEHAATSAAISFGGHVRVGFENNMKAKSGDIAEGNFTLVNQIAEVSSAIGRSIGSAKQLQGLQI
jgi:uncharacterized protein (DUF849 family)